MCKALSSGQKEPVCRTSLIRERALTATLDELTEQLLSLPIDERATLAQRLWASLDVDAPCAPNVDRELLDTLKRRNADMDRGAVQGRPHSEVMAAARKALDARLMESGS